MLSLSPDGEQDQDLRWAKAYLLLASGCGDQEGHLQGLLPLHEVVGFFCENIVEVLIGGCNTSHALKGDKLGVGGGAVVGICLLDLAVHWSLLFINDQKVDLNP